MANKESRLRIRVDPQRKAVIARAAKQHGHMISDFVLENAYQMATELLADEGTSVLSKKQVAHIFEVLDHPHAKGAETGQDSFPKIRVVVNRQVVTAEGDGKMNEQAPKQRG